MKKGKIGIRSEKMIDKQKHIKNGKPRNAFLPSRLYCD